MKKNILQIAKLLYSFILSILFFSLIVKKLPLNLYLTVFACILSLALLMLAQSTNAKYLFKMMLFSAAISLGYIAAKLLTGSGHITALLHGEQTTIAYRIILIIFIIIECIYICKMQKTASVQATCTVNEEMPNTLPLFPSRENDLDRLSKYINEFDTIGILGDWGSGKTYLVNEFIRRNQEHYEVIIIETLTCNLDSIDSYLFQQLEHVLWRNRIYPRYSRQIQSTLGENGILKQLRSIFFKGSSDKTNAFYGFCKDIKKLPKTILLVCEDIDRISESYADQIAKILDLSSKLAGNNVKVIYEYDQDKMTALGFGTDYMEKYVPFTINLSDIAFKDLVDQALSEETQLNGDLCKNDFSFFSCPLHLDYFLSNALGLNFTLSIQLNRITPRKVKSFIKEINLTLANENLVPEDNKRTIIAFYYLKIFMWELYEKLPFFKDFQDEIKFEMHKSSGNPSESEHTYYYSIMELANLLKNETISPEEVHHLFSSTENEAEDEYVIWNRNKLALLIMFQFNFKYLQHIYDTTHTPLKKRMRNPIIDEDIPDIQQLEHNAKINSLIKNLYMNGKSEYTNNEANAMEFIDTVLFATDEERERKWGEFSIKCFLSNIYKDNHTIFLIGGDDCLSLAKALRTVTNIPKYASRREEIQIRFFDFWYYHSEDHSILLKTIKTFCLIEPESQKSFIKAITTFNKFTIAGNLNDEKVYVDFLNTYINIAYRLGYLSEYHYYYNIISEFSITENFQKNELLNILDDICTHLKQDLKKQNFPPSTQNDFEELKKFIEKNIAIIKQKNKPETKPQKGVFSTHSITHYQNEAIYNELKTLAENHSEGFRERLDKEYVNGNISLVEYRRLLDFYQKQG